MLADSPLFSESSGRRVVAAILAYKSGDVQAIIGVIPLIEAALGSLCRIAGLDTVKPIRDRSSLATEHVVLGGLLAALLDAHFDAQLKSTFRYWRFVLADRFGVNLRNQFMHGFWDELTTAEAALIIQILISLAALRIEGGQDSGREI